MSAAEEPTPFQQAVDGLELDPDNSSCIMTIKSDDSQLGGHGSSVDINNIIILIVLAHGLINLTEEQIRQKTTHPFINTESLPKIENLAYLGIAPTGMVNIGIIQELSIFNKIVEQDMTELITSSIESSLQSIENKAQEIVHSRLTDIRSPIKRGSSGIVSRICNVCFNVMRRFSLLADSVSSIVNYTFKGILSVCKKTIPTAVLSRGGGKRNTPHGDDPDTTHQQIQNSFSMSHDMCVLLFDDLRESIKRFDGSRFRMICHGVTTQTGQAALANCDARCRKLHIVKGFGSDALPQFVNKHLAYNHDVDKVANMGVIKLSFSINGKGEVICNPENFDPRILMGGIGKAQTGVLMWSSMEEWIRRCTYTDQGGKTVCVVDLSCSSFLCGTPQMRDLDHLNLACPGGGKGNKKKSKSTKKARRNSRSKRIRNIRNRRKCKNNTKKLKKSRRR